MPLVKNNKIFWFVISISLALNFYLVLNKRQAIAQWISNISENDDKTDLIKSSIKFYDAHLFSLNGKYHTEAGFSRLPKKYQPLLRRPVWGISRQSAGINIHFSTNSSAIYIKWSLGININKPNMTRIGSGGVDLYCKKNGSWQFVNAVGPQPDGVSFKEIISEMDTGFKEFMLYFPLFDEVSNLKIGILKSAKMKNIMPSSKGLIVFYGSSITQGSGASRPGMAYPSIVSRKLNLPVYNLGFDGNGKFDIQFSDILCETNANLFVIDCVPNSNPELIRLKALPLILKLHKQKPSIPILLIESITRENTYFDRKDSIVEDGYQYIIAQNKMLSSTFNQAKLMGVQNIYYLKGEGLIGYDHEGTVDGTHLTDLGSSRFAEKVALKIQDIFKKKI
jgi:lysophospholipase L1-like esterase